MSPFLRLLSPLLILSSAATAFSTAASSDIVIVGCGVLGTSLCRQLLRSPDFAARTIVGITKSTTRHDAIREQVLPQEEEEGGPALSERLRLVTMEDALSARAAGSSEGRCRDVVFCAPPSGFEDYPRAVREAATRLWSGSGGGGSFVFTSSGGVYEGIDGETVDEASPTVDPMAHPRSARILGAEEEARARGGCALRLAGLYTRERGAHNFWLEKCREKGVGGREDGLVNLLHYDDAASACLAALRAGPAATAGRTFLISDGRPTTRRGICESALKSARYAACAMPPFSGPADGPRGKIYDGSKSNEALQWKPTHASFDAFMASH